MTEKDPNQALDAAEQQLRERDYAAELRACGASPVHQLAVAFDGKRVVTAEVEGRVQGQYRRAEEER